MPTFGSHFSDPFFSKFIAGIGNEAAVHDYDLLVSTHAPDSEGEQKAYRRAVQRGWVDGLIVVRTREDDARIQLLCEHQFPYVDEDSEAGMRLLVQHFIDLGHERIGLIAPPPGLMFGHYRLQSFYDTMRDNNLTIQPEWIVEGDLTQRGGAESVVALLALTPRPTAIIGGNDLMAIGAIKRIQQHGLKVGQDIAVGGFDDIPLSAYMTPPLTTIHQPNYEIGQETCAMLIDIVNGRTLQNPHVLLTPTLDVRASSNSLTT
jgi:DNA-binding LacI/PurR family transcriptional regulator